MWSMKRICEHQASSPKKLHQIVVKDWNDLALGWENEKQKWSSRVFEVLGQRFVFVFAGRSGLADVFVLFRAVLCFVFVLG